MATEPSDPGRELRDQVKVWSHSGSAREFDEEALALSPTDMLRAEHDLIRRVARVLEKQVTRIEAGEPVDPVFLDRTVGFLFTYAVRAHHGKEEEILFRALDGKTLSPEHRQMMEQLVREHVEIRSITDDLVEARDAYVTGDGESLSPVAEALRDLVSRYPDHLTTEEDTFFPAAESYVDDPERREILQQMNRHDRAMIHEAYGALADDLEGVVETWHLSE